MRGDQDAYNLSVPSRTGTGENVTNKNFTRKFCSQLNILMKRIPICRFHYHLHCTSQYSQLQLRQYFSASYIKLSNTKREWMNSDPPIPLVTDVQYKVFFEFFKYLIRNSIHEWRKFNLIVSDFCPYSICV